MPDRYAYNSEVSFLTARIPLAFQKALLSIKDFIRNNENIAEILCNIIFNMSRN